MDNRLLDNTYRFGLIGRGISYSQSPALHRELMRAHGIADLDYSIIDTDDIGDIIGRLRRDYRGFNVTKPYKVDIMKYLDEIDERAERIGSVNTVTNIGGVLKGYNTDLDGIIDTFRLDNIEVQGKRALVIGYGGVAKTVIYALNLLGVSTISVTGRNIDKMRDFANMASDMGITLDVDANIDNSYDIVINATTVGTGSDESMPVDPDKLGSIEYYFDLIYTPRRTRLARELESRGVTTRDGLYMLVSQAARADEYYFGISMDRVDYLRAYHRLAGEIFSKKLDNMSYNNVVLVGFMGAGKSTIGRELASVLDVDYIDTDNEIESKFGAISEIFVTKGEDEFRRIESDILAKTLDRRGVIATGGGIIMRDDNIRLLRESNSLVIYLDATFDTILDRVRGSDRPLFRDIAKARALYDYRRDRYMSVADAVYSTDNGVETTIDAILKY